MKKFLVFLGIVLSTICSAVRAQEVDYIPDISLDMRGGYEQDFSGGAGRFFGDGLYLNVDGIISSSLSYSFNHRLASSYYEDNSGFNGTNWLTLTYETGDFAFTAGKDGLLFGSFEYDAYDLDSYYDMNSAFYNEFDCWQWGVSAAWYPAEDHEFLLQQLADILDIAGEVKGHTQTNKVGDIPDNIVHGLVVLFLTVPLDELLTEAVRGLDTGGDDTHDALLLDELLHRLFSLLAMVLIQLPFLHELVHEFLDTFLHRFHRDTPCLFIYVYHITDPAPVQWKTARE